MYGDVLTDSMNKAVVETYRRRAIQEQYNKENNIIPKTIYKEIADPLVLTEETQETSEVYDEVRLENMSKLEKQKLIKKLEEQMKNAARELNFEEAMAIRDVLFEIKASL